MRQFIETKDRTLYPIDRIDKEVTEEDTFGDEVFIWLDGERHGTYLSRSDVELFTSTIITPAQSYSAVFYEPPPLDAVVLQQIVAFAITPAGVVMPITSEGMARVAEAQRAKDAASRSSRAWPR